MNRLDNYFKDQLREHGTTPSSSAWERVEARISKKNNTSLALRIAAGIAAIGLVTIVVLDQSKDRNKELVAKKQVIEQPKTQPPNEALTIQQPVSPEASSVSSAKATRPAPPAVRNTTQSQNEKNVELEATATMDVVVMETIVAEHSTTVQPEKAKSKNIVIVYSLPPINKTKSAPEETALADAEKKTALQKVMDVAMEVRASESPLGELREAKDELFALEFKKDKNKTKN